ncbi:coiled-coil domain-containing protein 169 [Gouania willdenowi]|uniref:Coiled-coil domain-containing protein 169 n=1 Tax=Gouania willdenowi TaxID=441366 RepID=A0A8C5GPP0_GOUWI|nr:coiled-coil domain-containing protein 169 [Gouania willdenowi]
MAKESEYNKYDLTRLQAELEQQRELREMLEESVYELQNTMSELQKRLSSVDGEGNEWKTRYETQVDVNDQLERQISLIHQRLEDIKGNPMDRLAAIRSYDDMPVETLKQHLKLLSEEKSDLQNQLRDCHIQIEQEGKAFHKTNDERRAYLSEIGKFSSSHDAQRRHYLTHSQRTLGSKPMRKQSSKKQEADSKKGKDEKAERGRERGKAGGGDGGPSQRKEKKTYDGGSRLPNLKHHPRPIS